VHNERNTVFNKISIAGNMGRSKELKTISVAQQLRERAKNEPTEIIDRPICMKASARLRLTIFT
jgi:hypothetical protein